MTALLFFLLISSNQALLDKKILKAVEIYKSGNLTRAINLFLEIEANIDTRYRCVAKYNLARAYHKDKQAENAQQKYQSYLLECNPKPQNAKTARDHLEDLRVEYFGALTIECVDKGLKLALDENAPRDCPLELPQILKGAHHLKIYTGERALEDRTVEIKPAQKRQLQLPAFARIKAEAPEAGRVLVGGVPVAVIGEETLIAPSAQPRSVVVQRQGCPDHAQVLAFHPGQRQRIKLEPCAAAPIAEQSTLWPWITTGTGVALIAAGLIFYSKNQDAARAHDEDSTRLYYSLGMASYGLGGGLLMSGLTWGLWPNSNDTTAYGMTWGVTW